MYAVKFKPGRKELCTLGFYGNHFLVSMETWWHISFKPNKSQISYKLKVLSIANKNWSRKRINRLLVLTNLPVIVCFFF